MNEQYEFIHPENSTIKTCTHMDGGAVIDRNSTPAMPCFTATRPLTVRPAEQEHQRGWRSGMQEGQKGHFVHSRKHHQVKIHRNN
jgi:hypothetical protein